MVLSWTTIVCNRTRNELHPHLDDQRSCCEACYGQQYFGKFFNDFIEDMANKSGKEKSKSKVNVKK
jgi:hypothetical protein